MTMLARAKAKKQRRPLSAEELALVAAFLKPDGGITLSQVMAAINEAKGGGIAYVLIARGAKELVRIGRLEFKK